MTSPPIVAVTSSRAAIAHDFMVADGGAERCVLDLAELLPSAALHTTFFDERRFGDRIDPARVRPWKLNRVLGPTRRFRSLLPLYPLYFTSMDLREADLVISSSVAFSKAVRTRTDAVHISYVYTPLRYAWDLDTYLKGSSNGVAARLGARILRPPLQRWDRWTSSRPDVVVAISRTVQERIARRWGRDSVVIYPPVNVDEIELSGQDDGFLLVASRMLAYRRLDLVVRASRRLGRRLVVVGDGPERARLESMAGPETTFPGHVGRERLLELFATCSAYVVPGVEDFGIAPVEAMAAGKPVVAFRGGGATETVVDNVTGVFFDEATVESLAAAIDRAEHLRFDPEAVRRQAERFDRRVFLAAWRDLFGRLGVDPSLYSAE
jgi:glycosyltransferase involved in cell wall biosynthesis